MSRYEVWCQAHIDARPFEQRPRYLVATRKEALGLKKQADRECMSKAKHFVIKVKP